MGGLKIELEYGSPGIRPKNGQIFIKMTTKLLGILSQNWV